MDGTELHVQASVWNHGQVTGKRARHGVNPVVIAWPGCRARARNRETTTVAVLIMEGEAPDRRNGGAVALDALYRAVLTRGLKLTTDLEHLDLHAIPGWRLSVDHAGAVTLDWPHATPLLTGAPLNLPSGWSHAAVTHGVAMLLVGYGLGLHVHAADRIAHPARHLDQDAQAGALAAGAIAAVLPDGFASERRGETGGSSRLEQQFLPLAARGREAVRVQGR